VTIRGWPGWKRPEDSTLSFPFIEQPFLEEGAHVSAQGFVMQQERLVRRHPGASIGRETAAGDEEVMDVGMAWRARRKARWRVDRHIGSVAVGAPLPP